jgi:filamentous hemagglutinin
VYRRGDEPTVELRLSDASSLVCTPGHRFWSVDRQQFLPAGQLSAGEHLLGVNGTLRVLGLVPRAPCPVFNIEVDVEHVYHVGLDGLLVHNACGEGEAEERISSAEGTADAAQYQLLKNHLTAEEIAGGHAFDKHILTQGEYPGWIRTRAQFQSHVEDVINNPTAVRSLQNGRTAYWHDASGTIVIRTPAAAD